MPWNPTSIVIEDWARLQLVINGVDVTYYRGAPFKINSRTVQEPFGDATLSLSFPQITSLEALPAWLVDNADVDLFGITPAGARIVLFEGLWTAEESTLSETDDGITITVVGALYQHDFYRKPPELRRYSGWDDDIAYLLASLMDPAQKPALRTMPLIIPGLAGVAYGQRGGWENALTGYAQNLLGISTVSGLPLPGEGISGIVGKPGGGGYWLVGTEGSVMAFGAARYFGSMVGVDLNEPASGIAAHPTEGYWFAARDGGVFTFSYTAQFYGSLGSTPPATDVVGFEAMPDGLGYAMVTEDGAVYNFGSSTYHGGINEVGAPDLVAGDKVVDFGLTPSGHGYVIVTEKGYCYAFGDAGYYGGANGDGKVYVAMAMRPQGDGYWLLASDGTIRNYGSAGAFAAIAPTIAAADLAATGSGGGLWLADEAGGVFTKGDATFHGSVPGGGGWVSQWTIAKLDGRQPKLQIKNVWDVQWTVACADQGVSHTLNRDTIMSPNVLYGEGVDPDGCIWRNTKYPNYNIGTAPVFGGTELKVGSTHADVIKWQRQMIASGWTDVDDTGTFRQKDSNIARRFQHQAGLSETGTVNAQTWAATFQVGSEAGDLNGCYFAPLAIRPEVDPYLYNPKGDIIGPNPAFNRNIARIEGYDNYGSQVTKWEGQTSSQQRLERDYPASYFGTITLRIDPEEGSRFAIKEGQNIKYKFFRGNNPIFHIAGVEWDWESGSVTLSVDTQARDMLTLAVMRQRIRENASPVGKPSSRASQQTEDRKITWDCESGAGIIPYQAINGGLWQVNRIPCGEFGQVIGTEFTTTTAARMSVAVFNKAVTPAMLQSVGASPFEQDYWESSASGVGGDFWVDWGLIMAWGGKDQAGGFYPGSESDGDPVTGRLVDDAGWNFEAITPPWLWVAMWVESPSTNFISGRFKPGVLT